MSQVKNSHDYLGTPMYRTIFTLECLRDEKENLDYMVALLKKNEAVYSETTKQNIMEVIRLHKLEIDRFTSEAEEL